MKPWVIVGIVVAVLGAVVLATGISYPSNRTTMHIGGMSASVQEHRSVPTWVGAAAVVGGALIVVAGLRGRRA